MKAAAVPAPSFEGQSPVSAYWLRQCEGFAVIAGRRRSHVEHVVLDEGHRHATALVVGGLFRRRVVSIQEVEAVVPAAQLVVLRPPQRGRKRVAKVRRGMHAAAAASAPAASALGHASTRLGGASLVALDRSGKASWSTTRQASRWLAPRTARAGRALGRGGIRLGSWTATGLEVFGRVVVPRVARAVASALVTAAAAAAALLDDLATAWMNRRANHD